MPGKYIVRLIAEEQDQLQDLVSKGQDAGLPNPTRPYPP